MQWAQALEKRPWLQGNCMPLGWQTTEGSPGLTWQAWGGSFLLLLRRHALSSRWLWTFNHNTWKPPGRSSKICYQFSLHATSFKIRGCVYSSCVRSAMLHASETWPLTKPNLQRLQRNDRAMIRQICNVRPQDIVTTRSNELLVRLGIEDLDLILKEKTDGLDMWNAPMVQSRQPLTYRLMESVGLGGPTWHGKRGIAESGSSRPSTLMIDIPGDLVWDLPCVQQASYLEGGPLVWMLPLYLYINQKSDYDDDVAGSCYKWHWKKNLYSRAHNQSQLINMAHIWTSPTFHACPGHLHVIV